MSAKRFSAATSQPSRSQAMQRELAQLNLEGGFTTSVLTNSDGLALAVASSSRGRFAEILAAVAPLVQRMVQRSNERAGLASAREVVVDNDDRSRLVCRFFNAGEEMLILACIVPEQLVHRRAMNRAVAALQILWTAGR